MRQRLSWRFYKLANAHSAQVIFILVVLAIIASVFSAVIELQSGTRDLNLWLGGWLQNFGTEILGALVTFWLIDQFLGKRQIKEQLIRNMGSQIRDVAIPAVVELTATGWLEDGSLKSAFLAFANLQGADLSAANLKDATLDHANLEGVSFWGANLEGAGLMGANLQGADLHRANLQWADLENATFDEQTILPDAELNLESNTYTSYWTPDTDMTRFTDPDHPDFWQPD